MNINIEQKASCKGFAQHIEYDTICKVHRLYISGLKDMEILFQNVSAMKTQEKQEGFKIKGD